MTDMKDIYWTNCCMSALKSDNPKTFEYCLGFIDDKERVEKIRNIQKLYKNHDPETVRTINRNYIYSVPIVVA